MDLEGFTSDEKSSVKDIDELNDETFGTDDVTGVSNWEEHHYSAMGVRLERECEEDKMAATVSSPFNDTTNDEFKGSKLTKSNERSNNILQFENLKDLWETSPDTPSSIESIWTPSLPAPQPLKNSPSSPIHIVQGGHGDGGGQGSENGDGINGDSGATSGKVNAVSVQELERLMMESNVDDSPSQSPPISLSNSPLASGLPAVLQNIQNSPSPPPPLVNIGLYPRPPPHPMMYSQPRPPPGFPVMGPHPHHHHFIPPYPSRAPPHFFPRGPLPQRGPMSYLPPNIPLMGPPRLIPGFQPRPPVMLHQPQRPPPTAESHRFNKHQHFLGQIPLSKINEMLYDLKPDGSGFMTKKEKEWVIKVQLIQLHSANPAIDDYYYQKYIQRIYKTGKEEGVVESVGDKLTPLTLPPPVVNHKDKAQSVFEGTLGKVSVGSASAPRKTIDVTPPTVNEAKKESVGRKKQALITIEKMYTLLLELEDLDSISSEDDDKIITRQKKVELSDQLFLLLSLPDDVSSLMSLSRDSSSFQQLMSFPKGKRLFKRVLPFLSDDKSKAAVFGLCKNLPSIIKKDVQDQVLVEMLPDVSAVINICNPTEVHGILHLLKPVLSSKYVNSQFCVSFITSVVNKGYQLEQSSNDDWTSLLSEMHSLLQKSKSKSEQLDKILTVNSVP